MHRVLLALTLWGCSEIGIDPIDDTGAPATLLPVTETFVQRPLPAVDLLLVIDDTSSMGQEQAELASDVGALASALDAAGIAWQLGVVTTDMSGSQAGWLRGTPYVLASTAPNRDAALSEMIQVGTSGAGPEAGLAAAVTALDLAVPDEVNAGFRRPGAALHVIFFSDADDASHAWLGADPVGAFRDALADQASASGSPAIASGIVGEPPAGCVSDRGNAQPGTSYDAAIRATGGALVSICATDFAPLVSALGDLSIVWPTSFPLGQAPVSGSVQVSIDEVVVLDGWYLDEAAQAVVFDDPPPASSRITVSYLVENA